MWLYDKDLNLQEMPESFQKAREGQCFQSNMNMWTERIVTVALTEP